MERAPSGFSYPALSMPGVSKPWQHGGGPGHLLPHRAARSSKHIGPCATGPSGHAAPGHVVRVCQRLRGRLDDIVHGFGVVSRHPCFRGRRIGGHHLAAFTSSGGVFPRPTSRPSFSEEGDLVLVRRTPACWRETDSVSAYPTDRVLGGSSRDRSTLVSRSRFLGEGILSLLAVRWEHRTCGAGLGEPR